ESEGHADGADSTIHIKLHTCHIEPAFDVLAAAGGQVDGTQQGYPDLAAMRVAAEHKCDGAADGMRGQRVDEIGRVAHEDDGLLLLVADGNGNGAVGVGASEHRVVDAGEPDPAAAAFDG